MSAKQKDEFMNIVKDVLNNNEFKGLDNEMHHGITRYGHSLRVAKATFTCSKALKLDYKSATRAAILHDFFSNEDLRGMSGPETIYEHPKKAAINAKKYFNISAKEENIIASHMFPLSRVMPKYAESWVVTAMDKGVALYEMYRFKLSLLLGIWMIFVFNMITIQK